MRHDSNGKTPSAAALVYFQNFNLHGAGARNASSKRHTHTPQKRTRLLLLLGLFYIIWSDSVWIPRPAMSQIWPVLNPLKATRAMIRSPPKVLLGSIEALKGFKKVGRTLLFLPCLQPKSPGCDHNPPQIGTVPGSLWDMRQSYPGTEAPRRQLK